MYHGTCAEDKALTESRARSGGTLLGWEHFHLRTARMAYSNQVILPTTGWGAVSPPHLPREASSCIPSLAPLGTLPGSDTVSGSGVESSMPAEVSNVMAKPMSCRTLCCRRCCQARSAWLWGGEGARGAGTSRVGVGSGSPLSPEGLGTAGRAGGSFLDKGLWLDSA